jgi:peptidoglycan/LPS O-acetylase OafA/YrhL
MTRRLLLLNGLAAFGVATYHAAAYGLDALFAWTDRYMAVSVPNYDQLGGFYYYMLLVIRQLDAYVIPAFIFISGYFVAFVAGRAGQMKWSVAWTRVKNFLIPLAVWTVVRFILLRQVPTTIHDFLRPYYFIVLLIQFYLLSPLLVPLAKNNWKLLFVITLLIQGAVEAIFFMNNLGVLPDSMQIVRDLLPLWFFPMRIFWFGLGLIAGYHREEVSAFLGRYKWALLVLALVLAPLTIWEYEWFAQLAGKAWLGPSFRGLISKFYALAFIFAFLAFDGTKMPFTKQISELGSRSLGIYLMNIPVIYVAAVLMYRFTPKLLGNQIVYQFILVTLGLLVPLLAMRWVSKSRFRWAYKYLFG